LSEQKISLSYNRQIIAGDVLERLADIPDGIIDCIITSPPYWAIRDYSVDGQWGLEKTFDEYLEKMKLLMAQLHRVLKNTGTCWINIGDTYSTGINGISAKSRIGIPERFYINCIDSGWISRNDITWIKWNAMPQSVKDRFTNKKEPVYFFAKNQKYYFNLDAVRIQTTNDWRSFAIHIRDHNNGKAQQKFGDMARVPTDEELKKYNADGTKKIHEKYKDANSNVSRLHKDREGNPNNKQDTTIGADGKPKPTYEGFNERWKNRKYQEQTISKINSNNHNIKTGEPLNHPKGKNPGDLIFASYSDKEIFEWTKLCRNNLSAWDLAPPDLFCINPTPMPEDHNATFPVELPQRIIKCSCPKQVCIKCGTPKIPITKPTIQYQKVLDSITQWQMGGLEKGLSNYKKNLGSLTAQREIVGYDTCDCTDEFIPGMVLDPFFGAGTTGIAAEKEGVRWCGIEIKEEYSTIAKKRLLPYTRQEALAI